MRLLVNLQKVCVERIESDVLLVGIKVLAEHLGDIASKIEQALGEQGICIVVLTPTADIGSRETVTPWFVPLIVVRVVENMPLTTENSLHAQDVIERVLFLLHQFEPTGICETITADKPAVALVPPKEESIVAYDAMFTAQMPTGIGSIVVAPQIAISAGSVTMKCNSAAAQIWFTTDGSYPMPASLNPASTATQYNAPFAAPGSGTLAGSAHQEAFNQIARKEARNISEIFQRSIDADILNRNFPR